MSPAQATHAPATTDVRPPIRVAGAISAGAVLLVLGVVLLLASGWHLTQGTSGVGFGDLLGLLTGDGTGDAVSDILIGSRLPRLAAAVTVGIALGIAGALLQSLARNALASPDTLAVTAGSYLAVSAVAAFGLSIPLWASGAVAFAGGLLGAAVVLGLAGAAGTATTRLVLAGSAVGLALNAATSTLLILFSQNTTSLFAWGSGSLSQLGLTAFYHAAPLVAAAAAVAMLMARRLDVLGLGDDTAGLLGIPVRSTRLIGTVLAVLLTAAAVTLAGPIGFIGLTAPVTVRLMARFVPALNRHVLFIPASGLTGALTIVLADVLIRAVWGAEMATAIPIGVSTTLLGAVVLVALARRARDSAGTRQPPGAVVGVRSRRRFWVVLAVGLALTAAMVVLGLLAGSTWLRTGDIALWLRGTGPPIVRFGLDERAPRLAAALAAGAALALAGSLVQATTRNPLAEPGILGVTGGAGLGAVIVVTSGGTGTANLLTGALCGALLAFAVVYGLSWRGGLDADRLVLIGIGVWYGTAAVTTLLLVRADPWNTPRIYTWLSGTTYGRDWSEVWPVVAVLVVALIIVATVTRELDLLALDEDTPWLVGVGVERTRLLLLTMSAILAAVSVVAVGVVGFVGLIAPHAARALVGGRHSRSVPVAVLFGAVLLATADTVGRTVIAPAQIPAGLGVALIGAPCFVYLLWRSRA